MFVPRVSGTTCFCEHAEVKMSELKRQLLLTSFIWGFLWFKCPFFRMGTELESKLNLNQEKQFSKLTLITHKYSHGSEDRLSEDSVSEGIEGFSPMVLEIVGAELKGRCSTGTYIYIGKYIILISSCFGVRSLKPKLDGSFPSGIHEEWQMKGLWVSAALSKSWLFITTITTTVKKAFGYMPSAKSPDCFSHLVLVTKFCFYA